MSRDKGSKYERDVAKILGAWSGESVQRVPQSGGGGNRWGADARMHGDVAFPVESANNFVYECKKHEGWILDHVFMNNGKPIGWWKQVSEEAMSLQEKGFKPCLIFSRNRAESFVILPYELRTYSHLRDNDHRVAFFRIEYKNIREEIQKFDILMTTLPALLTLDKHTLWGNYTDVKFNILNE